MIFLPVSSGIFLYIDVSDFLYIYGHIVIIVALFSIQISIYLNHCICLHIIRCNTLYLIRKGDGMIFYFSATGNCKYVAKQLSSNTGEIIVSMSECLKNNLFTFDIPENENIGFVTPTYFWGLPIIVNDFLDKVKMIFSGKHYVYHISTYGTTTGQADRMLNKKIKTNNLKLDAVFCVKMVDTWTPVFNLSDKTKNNRITKAADKEINEIIKKVKNKTIGDFNNRRMPMIMTSLWYSGYKSGKPTNRFHVEDSCIGCGLCVKNCPMEAITMVESKPVWTKSRCAACLSCLHHCPKFSIQYGRHTKRHGQFTNPNIK